MENEGDELMVSINVKEADAAGADDSEDVPW